MFVDIHLKKSKNGFAIQVSRTLLEVKSEQPFAVKSLDVEGRHPKEIFEELGNHP